MKTPPIFLGDLYNCLDEFPYTLPEFFDADEDKITVDVFLGKASDFILYHPHNFTFDKIDGKEP